MASDSLSLTVYIPSYGRWERCLAQVSAVRRAATLVPSMAVRIIVSVNGDPDYCEVDIRQAGADEVIMRRLNLGANANIALGLEFLTTSTYLWILSDDEIIAESILARVEPLLHGGVDLVCASWGQDGGMQTVSTLEGLDALEAFYGLISANIFRGTSFEHAAEQGFNGIVTSYPHAYLIARTLLTRSLVVATVPMREMLDHGLSLAAVTGMNRMQAGRSQGAAFFGGGILVALADAPANFPDSLVRWWREHWHRASMYRLSASEQTRIVDSMARGSVRTLPWYLLSLLPWWRLKERLRPRHSLSPMHLQE